MKTIQEQLREVVGYLVNVDGLHQDIPPVVADAAARIDALEAALRDIGPAIDAASHWVDMRGRVDHIIDRALEASS